MSLIPIKCFSKTRLPLSWHFTPEIEQQLWQKPCLKILPREQKGQTPKVDFWLVHSYRLLHAQVHIQTFVYIRHTHTGFVYRWWLLVCDISSFYDPESLTVFYPCLKSSVCRDFFFEKFFLVICFILFFECLFTYRHPGYTTIFSNCPQQKFPSVSYKYIITVLEL